MRRSNFHIEDEQYTWLSHHSEILGVPSAEIIRRAIAYWIDRKSHPAELLIEMDKGPAEYSRDGAEPMPFGLDIIHRLTTIEYLVAGLYRNEKYRNTMLQAAWELADREINGDPENPDKQGDLPIFPKEEESEPDE